MSRPSSAELYLDIFFWLFLILGLIAALGGLVAVIVTAAVPDVRAYHLFAWVAMLQGVGLLFTATTTAAMREVLLLLIEIRDRLPPQ